MFPESVHAARFHDAQYRRQHCIWLAAKSYRRIHPRGLDHYRYLLSPSSTSHEETRDLGRQITVGCTLPAVYRPFRDLGKLHRPPHRRVLRFRKSHPSRHQILLTRLPTDRFPETGISPISSQTTSPSRYGSASTLATRSFSRQRSSPSTRSPSPTSSPSPTRTRSHRCTRSRGSSVGSAVSGGTRMSLARKTKEKVCCDAELHGLIALRFKKGVMRN